MELDLVRNFFYDWIWRGGSDFGFGHCSLMDRNDKVMHGLVGCAYNFMIRMS